MAKSSTTTLPDTLPSTSLSTSDDRARVVAYYEGSNLDYRFWSRGFQMHFGYYRWGRNPFDREGMLREMNRQVLSRLGLGERSARVIDLGCGLGAPARDAARTYPHWEIDAVSLVPWQIQYAGELTLAQGGASNLRFTVADYADTPFEQASFDGGYALESSCHAAGDDKHDFIREAARLLKPGARLVVADGFIEREPIPWPLCAIFAAVHKHWALPRFANHAAFVASLERHGFDVLESRDVGFRVAPSACHVPWVTLKFLIASLRQSVSSVRWGNALASILSPLIGIARPYFRYRLLVAERRPDP